MRCVAVASCILALSLEVQAEQPLQDYSFISGDDLFEALSQDSMILQGYILGVTDALKHSSETSQCFTIPLRPDADQVIYASYLDYWRDRSERPANAVAAITEVMLSQFACEAN